ncbi:LacI family DNA-binding transcriptional regulator [Flavobacterium quisquiliarum]|uniref:LacI family DNA-binding transcriptional regulator n=1 Tax=Flavobacterium quisquiliarum TaxID=1834436 RepID=A0ABV8W5B1_9FLAO|nr:LacI family DNA-binding transcriptional regulator [Flavobacterium quisquiliarum]MBW1654940.1 LacI family DNA-binding transcriptional regulator [Flavobacterium quisquiliarum]
MKRKNSSLKDIAEELKVSVTTVSFVLNGKAAERHISKEMTKRVLDYANSINYKPNRIAQSLRSGKTNILVFMVEDISDVSFSKLVKFFEDIAYQKGYKVIFCSIGNEATRSLEIIDFYSLLQVDGFVIVPSSAIKYKIDELVESGKPIVLLNKDLVKQAFDGPSLFKIANDQIESLLKLVNC